MIFSALNIHSKALHLEAGTDCTTMSFLGAHDRFMARRGYPLKILSDCGNNFGGAANELKALYITLNHDEIEIVKHFTTYKICWSFPPRLLLTLETRGRQG